MKAAKVRIQVDRNVETPMRDGVILRCDIYRLPSKRLPSLLVRLPYGKESLFHANVLNPLTAASEGYAVIVQDTRGCFASEGNWVPYKNEARDGADTIEWIISQDWSDGKVGMYGASYYGYTQLAAASQSPNGLAALAPFISAGIGDPSSIQSAVPEFGSRILWDLQMQLADSVRLHDTSKASAEIEISKTIDHLGISGFRQLSLVRLGLIGVESLAMPLRPYVTYETEGILQDVIYEPHSVPALNIGGWYDMFLPETIKSYSALRKSNVPTRLVIGPWTHMDRTNPIGELVFGRDADANQIGSATGLTGLQLDWFNRLLRDNVTELIDASPVRIFVMGINKWRLEAEWPLERAQETAIYLQPGHVLSFDYPKHSSPDKFVFDPANPVPTIGGATLLTPEYPAGPLDQRAISGRSDVLTYYSNPLVADIEVTGPLRARIWTRSSAPTTDFVVRLLDVWPDGREFNISDGINRIDSDADTVTDVHCSEIDLRATSNVFKCGHRIGLHVTSSSFPQWEPNPNAHTKGSPAIAHQQIFHDAEHPSHLILPIASVGG